MPKIEYRSASKSADNSSAGLALKLQNRFPAASLWPWGQQEQDPVASCGRFIRHGLAGQWHTGIPRERVKQQRNA